MTAETVEYRVRRGDTLQKIVKAAGFPQRDWRRVYDAPYNRAFRAQRPDPDSIQVGDRLRLPRYNARQVADIVSRIAMVERRFGLINRDVTALERAIAQLERAVRQAADLSERDLQRQVADLQSRAAGLEDVAETAANECSDMYSCIGGGLSATRFTQRARRLQAEARQLERNVSRGEKEALKSLRKIRERLREFTQAMALTAAEIAQLRALYRRAARNPYS